MGLVVTGEHAQVLMCLCARSGCAPQTNALFPQVRDIIGLDVDEEMLEELLKEDVFQLLQVME